MRYLGIDLARSVAIIFVILGHALMGANVQEGAGVSALRFFLAVSPPVFFCLFGCMLQLIYARQYAAGRQTEIVQRLLTRAVQCWALYLLTCAAMCVAAGLPFTYLVRCALFLGDTPYTDILKFYAALLLTAPVLVAVSVRHGIWPLIAVCLSIQAAFPLISQVPPMQGFAGLETLSAFLYGGEYTGHTGPSVIHGLGFVVFGMLLGRVWQSRPGQEFLLSGPGWALRAGFLAMLAATATWIIAGGHNLLDPVERVTLRNTNHPLYLLLGCTAAIAFIEVFSALRRLAGIGAKSFWMIFGQTSLFTFCFGNILLYAVRLNDPTAAPDPARVVWSTLAALCLSILYYYFREGRWVKSDHPAARAYRWLADDSAAQLVRWATGPLLTPGLGAPKPLKPVDTAL
jgi:hypothetical protein